MENTLENKAKFFAHHWGQRVLYYTGCTGLMQVSAAGLKKSAVKFSWLVLKDLSLITNEDALKVCFLNHLPVDTLNKQQIRQIVVLINSNNWNNYNTYDYLRSKGYALPWMGLPVEQLTEYGWVKLKKPTP